MPLLPDKMLSSLLGSGVCLLLAAACSTLAPPFFCFIGLALLAHVLTLWYAAKNVGPWITLVVLLVVASAAFVPVTARDALIHHLFVAKEGVRVGSLAPLPWFDFSFYPALLQTAFAGIYALFGEWAVVVYQGSFLLIVAALAAQLAQKFGTSSRLTALILVTTPCFIRFASEPLVDLPFCAFVLAALLAFYSNWLFFCGLSLGFALATKYNALVVCFGFASLFAAGRKNPLRAGCGFLLSGFFFPLRNFALTGNFLYPLFEPANPLYTPKGLSPLQTRIELYGEGIFDIVLTPLRMLFLGQDNSPIYFDAVCSPLLVLGLLVLLSQWRIKNNQLLFLFIAVTFIVSLWQSSWRIRYIIYLVPLLSLLTAIWLEQKRRFLKGALFLHVAFAAYYLCSTNIANGVDFIRFGTNRELYLAKRIPEYSVITAANTLPESAKLYLLYTGNSFYLLNRQAQSGGYYSEAMLVRMLRASENLTAFQAKLREAGFTHLIMHRERTQRALGAILNPEEQRLFSAFLQQAKLVYEAKGFQLVAL